MESRQVQLVDMLRDEGCLMQQDLASRLDVSVRTVRTWVRAINGELSGIATIEHKRGEGYRLIVCDADGLDRLTAPTGSVVPRDSRERVHFLLIDLLNRTDWVTVDELSSMLYVSRVTISDDLKAVEAELARVGLALLRRPRYGIRVDGPELSRRVCLANETLGSIESFSVENMDSVEVLSRVSDCVQTATKEKGVQINAAAYQNLLVHIAIAVARMKQGCYVPIAPSQFEQIKDGREFACAKRMAALVGECFDVEFPDEEIAYISIHIASKLNLANEAVDAGDTSIISDKVWELVGVMLERVWSSFHFDFRDDLELRMNLARHIQPLSVRLKYQMRIDNPLLPEIKLRFPLAYAMACEASGSISSEYSSRLSEDEIGYIALAFALAIERKKAGLPKKRIMIVCASGIGSARLLEHRYQEEFGDYLESITLCDVRSAKDADYSAIDYVFTTVPLGWTPPVPVRQVGFFLDADDHRGVKDALMGEGGDSGLYRYFDPRLFMAHLSCSDKREAISLLCEKVAEFHDVPEEFEELIWKREDLAPTSFGNSVAMPHPFEACSDSTFVCVALLNDPIDWGVCDVQAIFLTAVDPDESADLQPLYRRMARLLGSETDIRQLLEKRDFGLMLELLHAK